MSFERGVRTPSFVILNKAPAGHHGSLIGGYVGAHPVSSYKVNRLRSSDLPLLLNIANGQEFRTPLAISSIARPA